MIRCACQEDTLRIQELVRSCHGQEDLRVWALFFQRVYTPAMAWVNEVQGTVKAVLFRREQPLLFNGRVVLASVLFGGSEYPGSDTLRDLFAVVMDACAHQELITLMPAGEKQTPGFSPLYERALYRLEREQFPVRRARGVRRDLSADDMLKTYAAFARRFNGFSARSRRAFTFLQEAARIQGGEVVGVYDTHDSLTGYASFVPQGRAMVLRECVYFNGNVLLQLVTEALNQREEVILDVSAGENLDLLLPGAQRHVYTATTARLNHLDLFGRLLRQEVSSLQQAADLSRKPLRFDGVFL